jgi:hypothetical protein
MWKRRKTRTVATASGSGFRTLLVSVYMILTLAALGRSGYQIATKFDEAPVAYALSAVAAIVYLIATIAIIRANTVAGARLATIALVFEAVGVVGVGLLSVFDPALFPADTVWSRFGQGYLFIPLVLPFVGLWWLRRGKVSA